jgi:GntR family transcriptional repressor for pyruvate dehydrogenase complex
VFVSWAVADRTTLTHHATRQIMQQIKAGRLRPGDPLPSQRELADAMGVSVPAVREAVQRLEVLGILEVRQGKNARVARFGPELLLREPELLLAAAEEELMLQMHEARETLDMGVIILATQRATPEDVEAIDRALIQQMTEQQSEYQIHWRLNREFHLAIAAATHNRVLSHLVESLLWQFPLVERIFTPEIAADWIPIHCAMYEAIREHDPVAAQRAMEAHTVLSKRDRALAIEAQAAEPRSAESETPAVIER